VIISDELARAGIFTERDLLTRVLWERLIWNHRPSQIVSRCRDAPRQRDEFGEAVRLMNEKLFVYVPLGKIFVQISTGDGLFLARPIESACFAA